MLKGFERGRHDTAEILEYSATGKETPIFVEYSGWMGLEGNIGVKYRIRCCNLLSADRPRGEDKCWLGNDLLIYRPRGGYSLINTC
jgi:hypothetical protein